MNRSKPTILIGAIGGFLTWGMMASANLILIDYDDGVANGIHDAAVKDGDFSVTSGTSDPWFQTVGSLDAQTSLPSGVGSARNIVMVDDRTLTVDVDYTLQTGDTFDVSFMWRDAFQWNPAVNTLDLILYTTSDNLMGGADFETVFFNSGLSTQTATWETASTSGLAFANPASVGKNVFVRINTNSAANRFARLDNVYVAVNQLVPEPGTFGLLAAGLIGLFLRRR